MINYFFLHCDIKCDVMSPRKKSLFVQKNVKRISVSSVQLVLRIFDYVVTLNVLSIKNYVTFHMNTPIYTLLEDITVVISFCLISVSLSFNLTIFFLLVSFFPVNDVDRLKSPKRGFLQSLFCCWRTVRTKTNQNGTPIDGSITPPPLQGQPKYLLQQVRHSDMHKKCMVIDLDETLVHSSFKVSFFLKHVWNRICAPLSKYVKYFIVKTLYLVLLWKIIFFNTLMFL